jgi:hypothetical protein
VAPTVEKGPGEWLAEGLTDPGAEQGAHESATQDEGSGVGERISSIERRGSIACDTEGEGCWVHYDEVQRTRLMADIIRLLREPSMPAGTRTAGMTLVGWLARRRPDEAPHAIGVEEARESERRMQTAGAKPR